MIRVGGDAYGACRGCGHEDRALWDAVEGLRCRGCFIEGRATRLKHPVPQSPMGQQVGGDHYRSMVVQPAEFIHRNGIGFLEGNVIKYVCRYKAKGGVADLEKAKHYVEMLIAMERDKNAGAGI